MGMWSLEVTIRLVSASVLVDQCAYAFLIVYSRGDQDLEVVRECDQSSVEHPVCCTRKRKAVADDVRTIHLDWTDMSSVNFGTAATID